MPSNNYFTCTICGYEYVDWDADCRSHASISICSRCGYCAANDEQGNSYVLTIPFTPGWVMIRYTDWSLDHHMVELYSEGVPVPFPCHFGARVDDAVANAHELYHLVTHQIGKPENTFFRIPPEKVVLAISLEAIGIEPGVVRAFPRDEDMHATVVPDNRVEHEGRVVTLRLRCYQPCAICNRAERIDGMQGA
jgi:hypothetical protein